MPILSRGLCNVIPRIFHEKNYRGIQKKYDCGNGSPYNLLTQIQGMTVKGHELLPPHQVRGRNDGMVDIVFVL